MTSELVSSAEARSAQSLPGRGAVARLVDRMLPAFSAGRLDLVLPNGALVSRRGEHEGPEAELVLHGWGALFRMARDGEHGFADGYLDGQWSTPDLMAVLDFFTANEAAFATRATASWITNARNRLMHRFRGNTLSGSRRNIAAHYDLGNAFYRQWLDAGMSYSSALFSGPETLEAAQEAKLDRVCDLLELRGGERVLEIGCGWGALAERLVRRHRCDLVGLTLSAEQLSFARERLSSEVQDGRADLRLQDYRDLAGEHDRVASIEMVEAVGERYWPVYFDKLRASLAPGGIAVLQAITIAEDRFDAYRSRPDFIQRYIFPGGMLPTVARIEREAERAGLTLVAREDFGLGYALTLREWRRRFLAAWDEIEPLGFDDRFRRMWEYYLAYCETGFRSGAVDVGLFKLRRPA